jgi:hypothetical protein
MKNYLTTLTSLYLSLAVFVYPKENHTVVKVGKDAFAACDLSANLQLGNWTSGSDVVPLDQPGMVWFICNKPNHCLNGMNLAINVVDAATPGAPMAPMTPGAPMAPMTPAPSPAASSPPSAAVRCPVGGAVAAAAAVVVAAALAF